MIQSISIKNFKSIASAPENKPIVLKLSGLNLFYGKNSSGKSSLLRAIVSMCDLMESKPDFRTPKINSDRIDLGTYKNLVYGKDEKSDVHIGISINKGIFISIDFGIAAGQLVNKLVCIKTQINNNTESVGGVGYIDKNETTQVSTTILGEESETLSLNLTAVTNVNSKEISNHNHLYYNYSSDEAININFLESYKIKNDFGEYIFERFEEEIHAGGGDHSENGVTPKKLRDLKASDFINSIDIFRRELSRLSYLGPHRQVLKRGLIYKHVRNGFFDYDVLFSFNNGESVLDLANNALVYIGLNYKMVVTDYNDDHGINHPGFTLHLENLDDGTNTSISDVGYGISQMLPILIELYSLKSEIMVVEQPELHLHPAQQALLCEVIFLATLGLSPRNNTPNSSRGSNDYHTLEQKKQVFVETHSEYFLLRLQRLLRESDKAAKESADIDIDNTIYHKISNNALKIYYAEKTKSENLASTTFQEIRLNRRGAMIDDWPNGFFEERWDDINA